MSEWSERKKRKRKEKEKSKGPWAPNQMELEDQPGCLVVFLGMESNQR